MHKYGKRSRGSRLVLLVVAAGMIAAAGCEKRREESVGLLEARKGFETKIIGGDFQPAGPADRPPGSLFKLVRYKSNVGALAAYVPPDPGDGVRRPAVIWAHGGFGGVGSWLWQRASADNDQSVRAFLGGDIVTMCPSWRGENDNPGQFELFYGEVNDLLGALKYLKSLPYVDPDRIYLAGHSTGGTMALLGSVASSEFRAVFSFGGAPDIYAVVSNGGGYGNTPFDHRVKDESHYRSAIVFTSQITSPTFYFEGADSGYCPDAIEMQSLAEKHNVPFKAFVIRNGTHFNILRPLMRMIAAKIKADTGAKCNITISERDVRLR